MGHEEFRLEGFYGREKDKVWSCDAAGLSVRRERKQGDEEQEVRWREVGWKLFERGEIKEQGWKETWRKRRQT